MSFNYKASKFYVVHWRHSNELRRMEVVSHKEFNTFPEAWSYLWSTRVPIADMLVLTTDLERTINTEHRRF